MKIRRSKDRGFEDKGWLSTYHSFSFDTYYDANFRGYHSLRVLNEDTIKGGKGFAFHSHKDTEIITYVLKGALEHKDSMGYAGVIREGEVQRMSAGQGVTHSEFNLSHHLPVHFLQIWISPKIHGTPPSYTQKLFSSAAKWGQWCLLVSGNGREGSIPIHQDVNLYSTLLEAHDEQKFDTLADRFYWIQVVSGTFLVQKESLEKGDGAAVENVSSIAIQCLEAGELLLFDIAD